MLSFSMKSIAIYHEWIPIVGGIETAVYELAKGLTNAGHEVTVIYSGVESYLSLFHYAEVANIAKLTPEMNMKVDTCILASNHCQPKQIHADKYLQWVHSDYKKYQLTLAPNKIDEYIAVSQHCADVFYQLYGKKCTVIYNLISDDFGASLPKHRLRLVTNSRVSPEKGFGRMLILAKKLKESEIPFVWTVYGDNSTDAKQLENWKFQFKDIEEVQFVGYKSDITIGLENADYLVQLSNFEGCPLAILEALKMKVPCIVTNWGGVEELIKDGENGYIVNMEMDNIDFEKIGKHIPKFNYSPLSTIKDWEKVI